MMQGRGRGICSNWEPANTTQNCTSDSLSDGIVSGVANNVGCEKIHKEKKMQRAKFLFTFQE